jgi:hypothetical protein
LLGAATELVPHPNNPIYEVRFELMHEVLERFDFSFSLPRNSKERSSLLALLSAFSHLSPFSVLAYAV